MINDFSMNLTSNNLKEMVQKNWLWLLWLGIALIILGTVSILVAMLTTLISIVIFGGFLMINGGLLIAHAIWLWQRHKSKFWLELGLAILYLLIGFLFIFKPIHWAVSLTLMLAIFYIVLGIYRGIVAITHKTPRWGWMLFSSLITLGLGVLILFQWPADSLWVIGLFVGIDILVVGWALVMSALSVRHSKTAITLP